MNPAQEHLAKALASRARRAMKDAYAGVGPVLSSGSGGSSSTHATTTLSPTVVSSKGKRPRADGSVDLTGETGKGTYDLPPCWLERYFFEGATLRLPRAESLLLERMACPEKRATLTQDAGGLMRVLEMEVAYTKAGLSQEAEMKNLRVKMAASEKALVEKYKSLKLFET